MTKRKVIEDSDDDENAAATPPRALAPSDITVCSLDGSPSNDLLDPSTSSTELLNRESRAAHQSLVEGTPQPLKTYGKSSQDVFEFHGSSDGELDTTPRMDLGHNPEKSKRNEKRRIDRAASRRGSQNEGVLRKTITSSGGDTELLSTEPKRHGVSMAAEQEGSLQSSMPSSASKSTSFDQSQRSQKDKMCKTADPLASESSTSSVLPPAVATYSEAHSNDQFSALMRTSGGTDDENCSQNLAQSVSQSMRSDEATRPIDLRSTEKSASSSSAFEVLPSTTVTDEGTNRAKYVAEEINLRLGSSLVGSALEPHMSMTINPAVLLPAPTDTDSAQDELSLSVPEAASSSVAKPPRAPKMKRNADEEPLDELGSDDNTLGLPKEQYQPRPSKRRAGGGDNDIVVPTDFSKRPEAIAKNKRKRKTKRHKTTAFQELLPKDEDEDEEIKVEPDSRFEIPEQKTRKLSTESGQPALERHDNTEDIRPEAQIEPSQAPKSTGQKKRGRPKKVATNLSEETIVDEMEADHNYDDVETDEHIISATAKKSRKKTKTKEMAPPIIDEQDNTNNGAPATQGDSEAPSASNNILNETNGNIIPPSPTIQSSPSISPAKANAAPPETPHKPATPAPKGPDKHSPISSGKVAYRVGLSKRARIAPLLRIVRK